MNAIAQDLESATISIDDFMTGFLSSLVADGVDRVSIRSVFYDAIQEAYADFAREAGDAGCEVDFVVNRHPVHGDSPTVRMAITDAVQRDLISLDNPVYMDMRIKITPEYADRYLESLPGRPAWYRTMTRAFLTRYSEMSGV